MRGHRSKAAAKGSRFWVGVASGGMLGAITAVKRACRYPVTASGGRPQAAAPEVKASSKMAAMAKKPASPRDLKRKMIANPREIPRRFRSRAAEAAFWESHDFAPGVLAGGERVRKELDEFWAAKKISRLPALEPGA